MVHVIVTNSELKITTIVETPAIFVYSDGKACWRDNMADLGFAVVGELWL